MTLYIVFTFDDFSRDACAKVADILRSLNVKGVFFVNTGVIRDGDSQDLMRELAKHHEVGSHSHSHLDLTQLQLNEVLQDLLKSREVLHELTGRDVKSFAYPYGRYNNDVISAVRKAGFTVARTIEVKPPLTKIEEPLKIPTLYHDYPLTNKRLIYEVLRNLLVRRLNVARLYWIMLTEKQKGPLGTIRSLLNFISSMHWSRDTLLIILLHPWMIERLKAWEAFEEVVLLGENAGRVITLMEAYEKFYIERKVRGD
jgi:peptidoglycan/xylan/chitin deacetylase (PgdA/CDA1 family)